MVELEKTDNRRRYQTTQDHLHQIRVLIRECTKYHIDYDTYVDTDALKLVIKQLECCLEHKDSRYIERSN